MSSTRFFGRRAAERTGDPDAGPAATGAVSEHPLIDDREYADGEGHRLHVPGARPSGAASDDEPVPAAATRPAEARPATAGPVETRTVNAEPVETRTVNAEPVETRTVDTQAAARSAVHRDVAERDAVNRDLAGGTPTGADRDAAAGVAPVTEPVRDRDDRKDRDDLTGGPTRVTGTPAAVAPVTDTSAKDAPAPVADTDVDDAPVARPTDQRVGEPVAPVRRARTSFGAVLALIFGLSATYAALTGRLAPVALVLGIVGLLFGGAGLAATVKPHIAGRGVTVLGLVLSFAGIVLALLAFTGVVSWLDGGVDEVSKLREWLDDQLPWLASWK